MLDTHARKYFNPLFDVVASIFIKANISANAITMVAFIVGIISAVLLYFEKDMLSLVFLWLSGFLDVIDGEVARKTNTKSMIGAQFDIISDRIVEILFIWAIALKNDKILYELLFLVSMILISMTVFLTTGMISKNDTKKSFYYQSGIMERTEGFIMFTLMIIFKKHIDKVILVYALLILFTILQRIHETIKINLN